MKLGITNFANIASEGAFAVTSDINPNFDDQNIVSPDFSTRYLSAGSTGFFAMQFVPSSTVDVNYIAIGGHNFGDIGGNLVVFVDLVPQDSVLFARGSRNNVVMLTFPELTSSNVIDIQFIKEAAEEQISLRNIQMGLTFDFVDNTNSSEKAGYKRAWLENIAFPRKTISGAAQPIQTEQERKTKKMSLSVSNLQADDFVPRRGINFDGMYKLLDKISLDTIFYFKEYDGSSLQASDNPRSSYLCMDAQVTLTAHGATRALNNLKINFTAYTGI